MTANNNIKMAEEADSSAEPDLLSGLESYVPPRSNKIASITEISFDSLLDPPLLLQEDLKKGCGGQLWPAGMVLAKYMLQYHRDDIADQTM